MLAETLNNFIHSTGIVNLEYKSVIMIGVALFFLWLAIKKGFEPLLLVPIAFGMLLSNLPLTGVFDPGTENSAPGLLMAFYSIKFILPSLIFMGVGAMTDFGPLIANPKSLLLGAAAQFGIFFTFIGAIAIFGFTAQEASAVAIIGGADGPTAIYTTSKLAPHLLGAVAVAAYSYMALVPVIQPPVMKALTSKKERMIKMDQLRAVSKRKDTFSHNSNIGSFVASSGSGTSDRYAYARKSVQRNGKDGQTFRYGAKCAYEYSYDTFGTFRRGFCGRPYFLSGKDHNDSGFRYCGFRFRDCGRSTFGKTYERFVRRKDQSFDRLGGSFGSAYGCESITDSRTERESVKLFVDACHGTKRCGSDRLCGSGGSIALDVRRILIFKSEIK